MTYRGIVRGQVVELQGPVDLPDGTAVEVIVAGPAAGERKGHPHRILAALKSPARCAPEDVEVLTEAIRQGRQPLRFAGPFDDKRSRPGDTSSIPASSAR
jgi:hypothetical protein